MRERLVFSTNGAGTIESTHKIMMLGSISSFFLPALNILHTKLTQNGSKMYK